MPFCQADSGSTCRYSCDSTTPSPVGRSPGSCTVGCRLRPVTMERMVFSSPAAILMRVTPFSRSTAQVAAAVIGFPSQGVGDAVTRGNAAFQSHGSRQLEEHSNCTAARAAVVPTAPPRTAARTRAPTGGVAKQVDHDAKTAERDPCQQTAARVPPESACTDSPSGRPAGPRQQSGPEPHPASVDAATPHPSRAHTIAAITPPPQDLLVTATEFPDSTPNGT